MTRALIAIVGAALAALFVWWSSGRDWVRWYRMYPESF